MNGAQALFKALIDAGFDTCFANPGTSEMQLVYEIGLTKGVRAVLFLQENTVTGAKLLHEGQFEGLKVRLPVFLARRPAEPVDHDLAAFYGHLLKEVNRDVFRNGESDKIMKQLHKQIRHNPLLWFRLMETAT